MAFALRLLSTMYEAETLLNETVQTTTSGVLRVKPLAAIVDAGRVPRKRRVIMSCTSKLRRDSGEFDSVPAVVSIVGSATSYNACFAESGNTRSRLTYFKNCHDAL